MIAINLIESKLKPKMRETKQVIIIRRDIKMRRGKEISQGAHASMLALFSLFDKEMGGKIKWSLDLPKESPASEWLMGSFTKITVAVQTEDELITLRNQSQSMGIPFGLIQDNGKTEFNGVKTYTALAIGPWWSDEIDKLTGHLPLY